MYTENLANAEKEYSRTSSLVLSKLPSASAAWHMSLNRQPESTGELENYVRQVVRETMGAAQAKGLYGCEIFTLLNTRRTQYDDYADAFQVIKAELEGLGYRCGAVTFGHTPNSVAMVVNWVREVSS